MKKIKFIIFTLFSTICLNSQIKAQVCNYCSLEELKSNLKENDVDYTINYNIKSDIVLINKEKNFIKEWHVEYNMCYLYRIIILDTKKVKSLKSLISKHYKRIDKKKWENLDNTVKLDFKDGHYNFSFYPKVNYNNLNNNY
jgi:hypothetical protein